MKYLIVLIVCLVNSITVAHPVAFSGSTGIMGAHTEDQTHLQLNYSWKYWLATGVHNIRRTSDEKDISLVSANFLLKRWNSNKFQSNIYGLIGAGQSNWSGNTEPVTFTGVQFDIEDRQYYFLTKYKSISDSNVEQLQSATVRFGVAPYVGNYEDLHIWYILDYTKENALGLGESDTLAPTIRFFYQNVLWELSAPINGGLGFNYVIHY